ncbi:MAG: hypothetical protein WBL88_01970 [Nitrososphaeraceae archaeon]
MRQKHVPYSLSATCNNKRNEFAYLKNQIQALEEYVNGLNNHIQQKIENEHISECVNTFSGLALWEFSDIEYEQVS